jgi:hypothetical protein
MCVKGGFGAYRERLGGMAMIDHGPPGIEVSDG